METGIHVGASQGTIEATSKAIMQILGMTQHEQATIQKALSVLCEITQVSGPTNITGNTIAVNSPDPVMALDPKVEAELRASYEKMVQPEVEVSKATVPAPKKRPKRKKTA